MPDAQELLDQILAEVADTEDDEPQASTQTATGAANPRTGTLSGRVRALLHPGFSDLSDAVARHELLQLLTQGSSLRQLFTRAGVLAVADDEEDDDTRYGTTVRTRRAAAQRRQDQYPKIPSEVGRQLMESGDFGLNERDTGQYKRKKKLALGIMRRELGLESPGKQRGCNRIATQVSYPSYSQPRSSENHEADDVQSLIPASNADTIINYDSRCYSGQFSADGNSFFSCSQDFKVRMYDTSNPYCWKYYKSVVYPYGSWTITDASLSPDNKFLAYSSIRPIVCLASTDPDKSEPHLLDFSDTGRRNHSARERFGVRTCSLRSSLI